MDLLKVTIKFDQAYPHAERVNLKSINAWGPKLETWI